MSCGESEPGVEIVLGAGDATLEVNIEEASIWDAGVAGRVFPASIMLGEYLLRSPALRDVHSTLELGAGVAGIPSIVAARRGVRRVVASDMGLALSQLQSNLSRNVPPPLSVRVEELDWSDPVAHLIVDAPDLILAAECVYDQEASQSLAGLLKRLVGPDTKCLLSNTSAILPVWKSFLQAIAPDLEAKAVETDQWWNERLAQPQGPHEGVFWITKATSSGRTLEDRMGDHDQAKSRLLRLQQGTPDPRDARFLDCEFWRELGDQAGLSLLGDMHGESVLPEFDYEVLRRRFAVEGFLATPSVLPERRDLLDRLHAAGKLLRDRNLAPVFLYVFDETWELVMAVWRSIASVFGVEAEELVLEPSVFGYLLDRPDDVQAKLDAKAMSRHTYAGGNFGVPHRDHTYLDCFDEDQRPTMVSVWIPLTDVSGDNGCMSVVPKEFDKLFSEHDAATHMLPFDASSGETNFDVAAAVALAPLEAGAACAWHGNSIHWGNRCSRLSSLPPRASLTSSLRLRSAAPTHLQRTNGLDPVTWEELPLSLERRVQLAAAGVLLYRWWYSLDADVVPVD
mmetsp:Transcript_60985/g.163582  ORF Transcript_60985/g.163582 Transcript_60985/m.163582 type:complete len:567 (+) Transcript_60985:21-1721(+)